MLSRYSFVIVFLLVHPVCHAQQKWSLQNCIDYALKNNISIKQADVQARLSALAVSQAKFSQWPSLNFGGNSGYRFGLSENPTTGILQSNSFYSTGFSLSAGVTLFNWFAKKHTLKASQLIESSDKMAVKKAENDVVLNISAAYLQALLAKELVTMASVQVQQTITQKEITQKKILMGVLSELDALQLQLQINTDSLALLSAEENKEIALLQLKAILNLDAAFVFDIEPLQGKETALENLLNRQREGLYQTASANLPEVRQLYFQMEAAQQRIKAAKASRYPTFSLYGAAGSNFVNIPSAQSFHYIPQQPTGAKVQVNGTSYDVVAPSYQITSYGTTPFFDQLHKNFGQNFGLSMSVPILNGKTPVINQKREELGLLQLKLQAEKLQQEIKTVIYTSYTEALHSLRKQKLNEKMVGEAEKILEASQKRYNLNLLSTQDLLIAKNSVEKAKTDLLLSKYDLLFKIRVLEFYRSAR